MSAPAAGHTLRLYSSYSCPWSHRFLIARALYGREDRVEIVNVEPEMDDVGWRLGDERLIDRYRDHDPVLAGEATVQSMFERNAGRIVSNDSAALMRLLGTTRAANQPMMFPPGRAKREKTAALTEALVSIDGHLAERSSPTSHGFSKRYWAFPGSPRPTARTRS